MVPHPLRSAATALDRGDLETAKQTLEGWTPEEADLEDCSELWWLLGRHADRDENRELAAYARIRSREIEIRLPRPPWACSLAESERIVAGALSRLPRRAQELLQAIPLLLEDFRLLRGYHGIWFVDNTAALMALIRGRSNIDSLDHGRIDLASTREV